MSVVRIGASPPAWGWAVLLLVACSEQPPAPREEMPDLLPGEVELDPSDIGGRGEGQQGEDRGSDPERDLPLEEDPRDGAYQALLDAQDRELRLRCGCSFEEFGQTSAEACFENLRKPEFAKACELAAFSLYSSDLGPRYACLAEARNESASCIEARGCGVLGGCEAIRDMARSSCGGLIPAEVNFADFDLGCERLTRLGSPSGCPDVAVAGSALGTKIFSGNTTGKGDDITLSCHWDFEGFESADLLVEWQAPAAGIYRFSTENSAFVTQLGILDGCAGAELACASSDGSRYGGAELVVSLEALQTVVVVLEGYSVTDTGYVALSVNPQL